MEQRDSRAWQRGLLLVEAVLSAVVIATGLVFVTRGLGGQLRALASIERYDDLLPLAEGKLRELEGWGLRWQTIPSAQLQGEFDAQCVVAGRQQPYRWRFSSEAHPSSPDSPPLDDVTLSVWCGDEVDRAVVLKAVWPANPWLES